MIARIFQGIAVSPIECLPSATIAEIYFLHERAYRVGIYTLLLLGGKNLIPLVSAAIIESLGWRWVFWIVAIVVGGCLVLLFFFVPETFWDRTPRPRRPHKRQRPHPLRRVSGIMSQGLHRGRPRVQIPDQTDKLEEESAAVTSPKRSKHAHFGIPDESESERQDVENEKVDGIAGDATSDQIITQPTTPAMSPAMTPSVMTPATERPDAFLQIPSPTAAPSVHPGDLEASRHAAVSPARSDSMEPGVPMTPSLQYTNRLRERAKIPYTLTLKVWNGRIARDKWLKVAVRPFVLFAYPAVLWSSVVYALSVGWLIVISESVATIFESKSTYNFTPLQTGLLYISPFVGGLLGTAVAGKVSDIVVRYMTKRNGGIYEPEFRLVMALPIGLSTTIGLMAFGWSSQNLDAWIVPTIFFGLISFGCCLGSTTAITFCVDSYRQYAGEALVTLNFSKSEFSRCLHLS